MALGTCKIKKGMGGSRNGRSRWAPTEYLKWISKRLRRNEGKKEVDTQIREKKE